MTVETEAEKIREKRSSTPAKGKGTRYSCLFSTVRQKAGTTYSLVKKRQGRDKEKIEHTDKKMSGKHLKK